MSSARCLPSKVDIITGPCGLSGTMRVPLPLPFSLWLVVVQLYTATVARTVSIHGVCNIYCKLHQALVFHEPSMHNLYIMNVLPVTTYLHNFGIHRARQLYKNISMLFLFPVKRDLLFTNI